MPLEDAIKLVGQNFDQYMADLRERSQKQPGLSNAGAVSSSSSKAVEKPTLTTSNSTPTTQATVNQDVSHLLSAAAAGKSLTANELSKLISSLSQQQQKLGAQESGASNGSGGKLLNSFFIPFFTCEAMFRNVLTV